MCVLICVSVSLCVCLPVRVCVCVSICVSAWGWRQDVSEGPKESALYMRESTDLKNQNVPT